jgi:hypothetical protein
MDGWSERMNGFHIAYRSEADMCLDHLLTWPHLDLVDLLGENCLLTSPGSTNLDGVVRATERMAPNKKR